MIDFLLAVPGKLTTIYSHLTSHLGSLRMAKVDNLDAAISTRAAAATAMSTAVWTNALADKIWAGGIPGTVKSIQTNWANETTTAGTGEDGRYADVTISAVVTAKCVVQFASALYSIYNGVSYVVFQNIESARLTSTTNLRLARTNADLNACIGRWTVIEYY